jgi:hypothetical protein
MNRRRLDFEALRDTLLAAGGNLDLTVGGRAVEITGNDPAARRTVYGFIDRQNLPGLFRTFDLANPDTTSPQWFATTVPQQALYLMNSPFVLRQAQRAGPLSLPKPPTRRRGFPPRPGSTALEPMTKLKVGSPGSARSRVSFQTDGNPPRNTRRRDTVIWR